MRLSVAIRFLLTVLGCLLMSSARADRAVTVWYDAAWHYRAPLTIPAAAAVNSTVVSNIDFNALLTQLGIAGTFDERSPRIVRPGGALATGQEYNERVYNGVLDAANNGRGEVRFIAQDAAAAGTYYVYFDIVANGAKAANAATPINGTFEQSVGSTPTAWVVSALNAGGAQNDEVYRTAVGATTAIAAGCATTAQTVDSSPARSGGSATGEAWMLLGYRDRCEDGSGEEHIRLSRDIAVPAGAAAGSLTFNFRWHNSILILVRIFRGSNNGLTPIGKGTCQPLRNLNRTLNRCQLRLRIRFPAQKPNLLKRRKMVTAKLFLRYSIRPKTDRRPLN